MRVIWISIAVFLLDQLTKYAIQFVHQHDSITLVEGWLSLVIRQNSGITLAQLNNALLDSNTWVLLGVLLTLPLVISRANSLFHFTTFRTVLGLQLTAGGMLSYSFDYLLRGTMQSSMELHLLEAFSLKAGVADFALISGFILLIYVLFSGATRISSRLPLKQATTATLNFSPLPRGIDNIHIDVHLSPEFCRSITNVVHRQVNLFLDSIQKQRPFPAASGVLFNPLAQAFLMLHQDALSKAKDSGEPQQLDLLYVALLKTIHGEVENGVSSRIRQAKETIQEHHQRGVGGRADSRYVEELFRQKERIIARLNQQMIEGIVEQQLPNLAKGVRGFLAKSRSFAMDAIRAPMVTANDADTGSVQFRHYLLFGLGKYCNMDFLGMERVLDEQLRDYLPLIESAEANPATSHKLEFENSSSTAATLSRPSVLAHPDNVTILFDQQWSRAKLAQASPLQQWRKYQKYRAQLRFQQRLSEKVIEALKAAGLAEWIITIYETRKILNRTNPELPPWNLTTLLLESKNSKELQKRLQQLNQAAGIQSLNEEIINSWQAIQKSPCKLLREHLYSFMLDFSRYRRDLQLLYKYHHASNQVKLLQDENSIQTSRANYTLYEFLLQEEKQIENAAIRSHIIIKADLRGSTEVTERLNQLALNPATHFDRNFFSPINEVINDYGAEKVFIEGDAIILILNDYAGNQHSHLIASRACGLAAGILEVVAKQNKDLVCYGLPELELGIGIAYSNNSPRFLFDGDHKITISPAINRADRLSACAWGVRNWRERLQAPKTHVEVYEPSERTLGQGEKAQKELIYNLNGILMEPEVFKLLHKEISPMLIVNKLPNMQESRLFAIKVAGGDGVSHSLIVRQAPVKVYDPEYGINDCPKVEGRYFYEVIHDREIINILRRQPRPTTA